MRKFLSNIVRSVKEVTLPLWVKPMKNSAHGKLSGKEDGTVVSLTSFPARIDGLWITVESLFRQTCLPDRIIIALTEEEFPHKLDDVPASLKKYIPLGVEIIFLPYNLRCHNKYLYALQTFPKASVITVDDDCYYRKDTLQRLLSLSAKYPGAVCCNIGAVIDPTHFHEYAFWKKSSSERKPDHRNVALGFAGVLYPAGLPLDSFCDMERAKALAPTADDLWLKAVEITNGIKVACGPFFPKPITVKSSQKVSLRKINKGTENRNDKQWKALDGHFSLKEKI
ncbi:MAG: glycosyltransferase [Bacteroidales bacterium]|nr:glycosyltransferase [Bacteroidales bacterium]